MAGVKITLYLGVESDEFPVQQLEDALKTVIEEDWMKDGAWLLGYEGPFVTDIRIDRTVLED